MLKKENKIFVAVCPDVRTRRQMISRLAVRLGFALIPSDAAKLIQEDLYSCDLSTAYFVMCAQYNFRNSPVTNQRLYVCYCGRAVAPPGIRIHNAGILS